MSSSEAGLSDVLTGLFTRAREEGGIEYVHALLRVEGITKRRDPLLALAKDLERLEASAADEMLAACQGVIENHAALELVANLIRCSKGDSYQFRPFPDLFVAGEKGILRADAEQLARRVEEQALRAGFNRLSEWLRRAYSPRFLATCRGETGPDESFKGEASRCCAFIREVLRQHEEKCRGFLDEPPFHKLPGFRVLEFVTEDRRGLVGIRMHYSNGTSGEFLREPNCTRSTNMTLSPQVGFLAGDLDALCDQWRIGEKRLYEVGLPGKYNKIGEWKPIVYPGDATPLIRAAAGFSDDPDLQGVHLYMLSTGHRVIEFAVRTPIDLPIGESEMLSFGGALNLWKCPHEGEMAPDEHLYDGWLDVEDATTEGIERGIEQISIAMNRLAFAFSRPVRWCIKYRRQARGSSRAVPNEDDLELMGRIVSSKAPEHASAVEIGIDWYIHGLRSGNPFVKFLCFYIALESVAVALAADKARRTKEERVACIRLLNDEMFATDPIAFVERAYFECVTSLKHKVTKAAEEVFGKDAPQVRTLVKKRDGRPSLTEIRSKLAHGRLASLERQDAKRIASRVPAIQEIAHEFLTRLILGLAPSDPVPAWSGLMQASLSASNPRNIEIVTKEEILPSGDWKLRPEWVE